MSRARQLALELSKKSRTGGKRKGAGRKRREFLPDGRPTAAHVARPDFDKPSNFHVTLRALPVVRRLRNLDTYAACRRAQQVVLVRDGFRLIQYSIQHNHVHLLVEA